MAAYPRDRALSFLAAANNHGDLSLKISSLKQARDVLLSMDPSSAAELFSYMVELQSSPETLVRKLLVDVLAEMTLQYKQYGKVERWLEEIWMWMLKLMDAVYSIALEPGPVGTKLLALKFLETVVLLFSFDFSDPEKSVSEGGRKTFNISWLECGHPVLDPEMLMSEASRTIGILLNLLQSARSLAGCLTIAVVN